MRGNHCESARAGNFSSATTASTVAAGRNWTSTTFQATAVFRSCCTPGPRGHEGNLAPDGLTYYIGDLSNARYYAVDISNTTKPKVISSFDMRALGYTAHGLSVSNDGKRMYAVTYSLPLPTDVTDPNYVMKNGFIVFDTSEVQARAAGATMKIISTTLFRDGSSAQHTIPIRIAGKEYLVMVDEGGTGGIRQTEAGNKAACDAGLPPFPLARLFDMSNEAKPIQVSRLMLETHDPKNCAGVLPDVVGLRMFTYGSHYCSVDNRDNATTLACAYFNPPPATAAMVGSGHASQWKPSSPDWCASRLDFAFAQRRLTTMCHDNGLVVLQFAPGVWPFPESTPSLSQN